MAKLNKATAKSIDEAKDGFEPLPVGTYHVKLLDVDATREGPKGPYWSWAYEVVEPGFQGRRLWNATSLADGAQFGLKQTFAAFGVPTDTDTDDLCGRVIRAVVQHRVIQGGAREGQIGEQVSRLLPADPEFVTDSSSDEDEDIFA